jgi:hypothetical protein
MPAIDGVITNLCKNIKDKAAKDESVELKALVYLFFLIA